MTLSAVGAEGIVYPLQPGQGRSKGGVLLGRPDQLYLQTETLRVPGELPIGRDKR